MGLSWVIRPIAIASAVAFSTLGILSRRYQKARLYFNVTVYLTVLGATSAWGVIVAIIASATGQRLNISYYVARSFYNVCSPLVGVKVIPEGQEHLQRLLTANNGKPQSAVVIANHQSMLDILFLGRIFPERCSIMAKKELKYSPLLGQFMQAAGTVFIDRKNRKDAHRTVQQAGEDMKRRGISLWIFPEGTRSLHPEPTMLPFKKGAFHLAIQAQVPIVPIVCENYHHVFDGRTRFDPDVLKVSVLPPIPTAGMTVDDVGRLTESTRDLMLAELKRISKRVPSEAKAAAAIETSVAKASALEKIRDSENDSVNQRIVSSAESNTTESTTGVPSRGETTTEDELDGDAVVLKRPKSD